jgi:hypothetical protein
MTLQFVCMYRVDNGDATPAGYWHWIIRDEHKIVAHVLNLTALSSSHWSRLCGLVCAYRLADIIALLGGCKPNETAFPPRAMCPDRQLYVRCFDIQFHSTLKFNLKQGMSKLQHWPTLLMNFHMLMQKVAVPVQNPSCNTSGSSTLRLLSLISKNEWAKNFVNIEGNFLIAAMHVSSMREFPFSQDSYPDIPERFESMANT